MRRHGRQRVLGPVILGLVAFCGFPQGAFACPLAPLHGSLCKYVDPGLFQSLAANAEAELLRLGAVNVTTPLLAAITRVTGRDADAVVQYDSLLQLVTRPRVPVQRIFAATWTWIHPDATVRVQYVNGRTEMVNVADVAQHYLDTATSAVAKDPLAAITQQVAALSYANGQGGTADYAVALQRVGTLGRGAVGTGADLAAKSDNLAQTIRAGPQDFAGQSQAQILAAKAGLDQGRAMGSALHLDASEHLMRAAAGAARARDSRRQLIRDILRWGPQ